MRLVALAVASSLALATAGCDAPVARTAAADDLTLEDEVLEEPYGVAPDGSRFRHTRLAKLKTIELVVGGAAPDDELPIVVMLHGLADKPRLPAPSAKHPRRPARIFLPRGPYVFEQGFAWYPHRVREGKIGAMHVALEGSAQHLALFLREVEARHPSPCKPVILGFSQGGMVTLATALARPETLSEAFVVAAWVPHTLVPSLRAEPRVPIRMMHGLVDPIVPAGPTIELARELERLGYDLELRLYEDAAHAMSKEMDATLGAWLDAALGRCHDGTSGA
jgi:phospholipase/carboxylesterase